MARTVVDRVEVGQIGWEPGIGSIKVGIEHDATLSPDLDAIESRELRAVILQFGEREPFRLSHKQVEELAVLMIKATKYIDTSGYFDCVPEEAPDA